MTNFVVWIRSSVLVLIAIASIDSALAQKDSQNGKPLDVIVQPAVFAQLDNSLQTVGTLKANEASIITAKSTKTIAHIYFDDGQRVKKGDRLVDMLNAEESALMQEAKINAEEAEKQWKRALAMANSGAIAKSQLDQIERDYKATQAHYQALVSRQVDQVISAPFDGVVGIRTVSVGSLITPGQTLTTIVDDNKIKLDFTLPSTAIAQLKKGLAVDAVSADLGGKHFHGTVYSIDNIVDEATRSIKVRAILDNTDHQLIPGLLMSVSVKSAARKSLVIGEAALVPMASNNFVFIAKPGGKDGEYVATKQQIQIGQRYRGFVEVIAGVAENDKVVTHGLQKIHPGQILKIMGEQKPANEQSDESVNTLLKTKGKGAL